MLDGHGEANTGEGGAGTDICLNAVVQTGCEDSPRRGAGRPRDRLGP